MITLHTFGPGFGLPDPSPFVMKAEALLAMSGLPFEKVTGDSRTAPKEKLPFIDDGGTIVADSTLIRFHLESRHGIDFDRGLTPEQKGIAWAVEKLCEDHIYWMIVRERWLDDATFDKGPRTFFNAVPAPIRPLVVAIVRRKIRRDLYGQGLGRHTNAETTEMAQRAIDSVSQVIGQKPWLMGPEPCGADASVHACIACMLAPGIETALTRQTAAHANLVAYRDRGLSRWFGAKATV